MPNELIGLLDGYGQQAKNGLLDLLESAKRGRVVDSLLSGYNTLTQPNKLDAAAAQYLMNTPNRMRQGINEALPDPRLLGPKQINTPEGQAAISQGLNTFAGLAAPIVYHGSPHIFNKFDSSKIGDGAQGYGQYFSESKNVAKAHGENIYEKNIADPADYMHLQEPLANQPKITELLKNLLGKDYDFYLQNNATGHDVYNTFLAGQSAKDASSALLGVGIPGARYSGNGTTNYVVFNP